jgi:hypothetical protein
MKTLALTLLAPTTALQLAVANSPKSAPETFNIVVTRDQVSGCLVTGTISVNGEMLGAAYANANIMIPAARYHAHLKYASTKNAAPGPFGSIAKKGDFIVEIDRFTDSHGSIFFSTVGISQNSQKVASCWDPSADTRWWTVMSCPFSRKMRR